MPSVAVAESPTIDTVSGKYLTFRVGEEEYGIGVVRVREIMGMQHITPVPQTPGHVRGVINLRGKVIPVIDMRGKLGFPRRDDDRKTCIVVVSAIIAGEETMTGVVVDSVTEVVQVATEEIEKPPSFGSEADIGYLIGVARAADRVRLLLDIDRVLDAEDNPSPPVS